MNSIIGTLVNGEINNKTKKNQNRVNFCSSFSFYVWLIGKTIISSKIVYVSRENMESKEKNVPTFSSFQKIASRTSFITHTTMIIYSNISL